MATADSISSDREGPNKFRTVFPCRMAQVQLQSRRDSMLHMRNGSTVAIHERFQADFS